MLHTLPTRFAKGLEGFFETLGGGDGAFVPAARVLVADPVKWRDNFSAEFRIFFEHRFGRLRGGVFAAGQGTDGFQSCQFVHHEHHIF